ncbi:MAG TPA: M20/M25/M40 family metallo-hydrolase [Pirellulales bacterium]|jgi:hypothetical protein|nr:M20/M25/M40 family metallo-hydrolase [Pirellulales bacterium]
MSAARFAIVFSLALGVLGHAPRPARAADAAVRRAALASITAQDVKDYVAALADDTFEGRESGTRGGRAAGIYIVDHLKKFGIPGGNTGGGYHQNFGGGASNLLALVEGSDPQLKQECIIISAHYDHVGYGNSRNSYGPTGLIHNGADDNASGVAGLLEVAQAVSLLPVAPRRSILFAFWDAEEKGLLGSKHWIDHPTVPLARVRAMMNVDMIGRLRNSRLTVYGVRTSAGFRQLVSRQNDPSALLLNFSWELKGDSDHYSFYQRGIPIVMLHTGMHDDYHRPSDDAEKVNVDGLSRIAQLLFSVLVELADTSDLRAFRRQALNETRGDQQQLERGIPSPPGRLGVRLDGKAAAEGQLVVSYILPGSAAERAGVRIGDRIVQFEKRPVKDSAEFTTRVLAAPGVASITVERAGEEEPRELTLALSGDPVRLGISWRTDEAEPGVVIVNRVVAGSLAERAGLRINDRIDRVSGHLFASGEEFRKLLNDPAENLVLDVEAEGRVRAVEVPIGQSRTDDAQSKTDVSNAAQ